MLKTEIEAVLKPDEVAADFEYIETAVPNERFTTIAINYIAPPVNYSLVHIDSNSNIAVLKNLDYVEPK